jgi:hypothetical protein
MNKKDKITESVFCSLICISTIRGLKYKLFKNIFVFFNHFFFVVAYAKTIIHLSVGE